MMTIRVRALVRGAVVSLAAIAMVFTVAVVPAYAATPTISMFSPPSGQPGTLVSVTGNGFTGGIAGVSAVTFNNVGTTFNVSDDQHLTATVPIGATTGKISVTTSDGVGTSVNSFVVAVEPDDQQRLAVERLAGDGRHDQRKRFHRRERRQVQRHVGDLQLRFGRAGDDDGPRRCDDRQGHRHHVRGDRDERFELHRVGE